MEMENRRLKMGKKTVLFHEPSKTTVGHSLHAK